MYLTNITLGSPPQQVRLIIDTGSSDTWCNTDFSDLCSQEPGSCEQLGTYNANSSSTYKYLNSDFALAYVDGTSAKGDFVSDNLTIGGKSVPTFEFGVAYASSSIGLLVYTADVQCCHANITFCQKVSLVLDMSEMKPPGSQNRETIQIYPKQWLTTGS